jgi:soluble lytic murein transglycosylase-like protein
MFRKSLLLTVIIIAVTLVQMNISTMAAQGTSMSEIKQYIIKTAVELGVEPEIALSIAKHESGFCQEKRSKMGAVGVFQMLPSTARRIGCNPYHYQSNIRGGITYYKQMKRIFKSDAVALAAYNAGPGAVRKYGGIPPYAETKKYVNSVMKYYGQYKTNPDATVSVYLANAKAPNVDRQVLAEKERKEILTSFMLNQAI